MKKLYALIIIASIFFVSTSGVLADSNHGLSVDKVIQEIMLSQNISDADDISCESITENQFEEMGEAVMALRHPDEREHEFMDQMMGGEGSESLKSAHVRMGKGYLGCLEGVEGMMMGSTGMMASRRQGSEGQEGGDNMMGNFGMMSSQMMGGSGYTGVFGSLWTVTWILIVILLVVMIRYFWNKGNAKK